MRQSIINCKKRRTNDCKSLGLPCTTRTVRFKLVSGRGSLLAGPHLIALERRQLLFSTLPCTYLGCWAPRCSSCWHIRFACSA